MAFGRDRSAAHRRMMVVPWTPRGRTLILSGLIVAIAMAALAGYLWGMRQAEFDREHLDRLGGRIRALELELEDAGRRLADADLAREVDRQALAIQREEMTELRGTARELREQLGFYRRVMDASSPGQALDVADFELFRLEDSRTFRYRVLLTRSTEQGDWVRGTARVGVSGLTGDSERQLSLSEISDTDPYPLDYRFRYFQRLTGSLTLPEGFHPLRVTVRLFPRGADTARVERSFNWPDAL